MIERTVEELTPIIGTRPACRAAGRVCGDDLPSPPATGAQAATAAADSGQGADRARARGRARGAALRAVRRHLAGGDLRDAAGRGHLPVLDADDVPASSPLTTVGCASGATSSPTPAYAKPELLAERPNELWSWDISKLKGPAKWTYFYLYVILDVFSRYVVGWTVQHRENAQLAKALIEQATEQQQITPKILTLHADRGAPHARQAGGVPARRPRRHEDAQPALHLQRQPLLGGGLQDAEVPARVPRPLRRHRARTRALPGVLRLVQPRPSPLRDRPDDPSRRPPRPSAEQLHAARALVLDAAYARHPERFVRRPPAPPELPTAAWINKPETKEVAH